ncbi:DNA sulfur modification protein DndB [Paenibacillus sp. FSL H7-689]|uniref:DNA sulfur modification protein DndB n=1 Tax=Paenibacillus sp. FSL H7-689 TaxID=1227349 RepID=UPI0003E252A2|nr:DNA sulfur modification protein DndB [Paenibacillus sp. FSL H7-689]ETT50179.1 DGQHR domain-containing protein [Paenibacillus sp. FSL H7-689]
MFQTDMDKEVRSLDQLIQRGDTSETQIKAFLSNNLGNSTLLTKLPMYEFYRMSDVANERSDDGKPVTQRKLDPKHAASLARYILKGLLSTTIYINKEDEGPVMDTRVRMLEMIGKQPYLAMQPIVANLRTAGRNGTNLQGKPLVASNDEGIGARIWLGQKDILWVVDGQHRRKAMQIVIEFLEDIRMTQKYPPAKSSLFPYSREDRTVPNDELNIWLECYQVTRSECTVNVEIHLGLGILEERQLFHDLNNLSKKMEVSLALEFDSSNPVNAFIKDELIEPALIKLTSGDKVDWSNDDGSFTRKDIVAINAHLILNKSNINGATPTVVKPRLSIAKRFWEAVTQINDFGDSHAKQKTVAAQPVVLKALAKLTYDFSFGRQAKEELLDKLLDEMTELDFGHDNPMWRYYQLSDEDIEEFGLQDLKDYLPDGSSGNRDIGNFEDSTGWMRFGSKHNDIFPIIGDMIRWKLDLPKR